MSFLSNLFGGGSAPQIQFNPSSFSTGGTTATYSGGKYNIAQTPALSNAVGSLQQTFQNQSNALGGLAATVQPGFSQFRQAGLANLQNQQTSALSNLSQNLAQRRVLGSSFANAQASQTQADFAQQQSDFIAQSYLQELQASNTLINQQYQAAAQSYTTGINQMNFDTGIAAQLTSQATQASANVATAQANLDAKAAAGAGSFLGSLLTAPGSSIVGQGASALGSGLSSAVSGIGGPLGDMLIPAFI